MAAETTLLTGSRGRWFHEHAPLLGAANALSAVIAAIERKHPCSIPNLRDLPTLLIGSDYSGFHKGAQFEVTSFVATNFEKIGKWDAERTRLREQYLPEQRRMSYKALNDGHRRAALIPFLNIANQIPGLLVSIAVDKNVTTIFDRDTEAGEHAYGHPFFDGWKPAPVERAMRSIHFASILLRGLSRAGQDLWWFTDQDEIVANEQRLRSFVTLMATVSSHYLPHDLRHMRIATTASDTGRRDIEDFVAIADFAAGALQEVLTTGSGRQLLDAPSLFVPAEQEIGTKVRRIMDWFADNTQPLQRLTLIVDSVPGASRVTSLRFHGSDDPDAAALINLC